MVRPILLVVASFVFVLPGCQIAATCQSHEFRSPGLYGDDCGECASGGCGASSCGTPSCSNGACGFEHPSCGEPRCSKCGKVKHNRRARTAPLFPGDSWGSCSQPASACSIGISGGCGCGEQMPMMIDGGRHQATALHGGCGCGEHAAMMMPGPMQMMQPQAETSVPNAPSEEFKAPESYDADVMNAAPSAGGSAPAGDGPAPVPPADDPADDVRLFDADPPLPKEVEDGNGAPPAEAPVDPVSWQIPQLP